MMEEMSLRRAEVGDQKALTALVSRCGGPSIMRRLFGSYTFPQLIETGYLSIIASPLRGEMAVDAEEEAVGFAVFSDTPRDCTDAEGWLQWLSDSHAVQDINIGNTLWVDFLLLEPNNGAEVLQQVLATTFNTLPEIDQVLFQIPAEERTTEAMSSAFYEIKQHLDAAFVDNPFAKMYSEYRLLICEREAFMPTLSVRQACVEDHDDLVPVFQAQAQSLAESFGEFFLADMIEAQDHENKALVALANDRAVGLMGVSSELDIAMLQQCFHLEPFGNFIKASDREAMEKESRERKLEVLHSMRVLVLGAPGSGSERVVSAVAEELGLRIIDDSAITSEQGRKLLDVGEPLELAMFEDEILPLMITPQEGKSVGFVLNGFPQTAEQASLLQQSGIVPDAVILVQVPEDVLVQRTSEIREDPETGTIYYGVEDDDEPESDEVFNRLVEREVDNEENVRSNYQAHRSRLAEVIPFYGEILPDGMHPSEELMDEEKQGGEDVEVVMYLKEDPETGDLTGLSADSRLNAGGMIEVIGGSAVLTTMCDDACDAVLAIVDEKNRDIARRDDESYMTAASQAAEGNTFAVTLFCLDQQHEARALDFLPHLFPLFEGREFCILTVPPTNPESVLLKYFTPAVPREGSTFSHTLYVLHRDTVMAMRNLYVTRFKKEGHLEQVKQLLVGNTYANSILEAMDTCREFDDVPMSENPREVAFVAMVGRQVVAAICANRNGTSTDDIAWLKANYHVESFVVFERHRARNQAGLSHLAVNPLFRFHTRYILKEVMRLYDKTVIYYEAKPGEAAPESVLFHMVPVRPRRRMEEQPGMTLPLYYPSDDTQSQGGPINALYFLSRRLLTEPKITVNWRVVVVGGSTCAVTFIEALVFTPYLNFTNIVLVSPSGLGLEYMEPGGPTFLPVDTDLPNKTRLQSMGLAARIRVIRSVMVDMDIQSKAILLPNDSIIPYDVLIIASGLQDSTAKKLGFTREQIPENLINLSDIRSQKRLEKKTQNLQADDKVVVYGSGIGCLTAISGLVESGVPGNQISLVRPGWDPSDYKNDMSLGISQIDEAVDKELQDRGVTLYNNLKISKASTKLNTISSLDFENMDSSETETLECDLMLCHDKHHVDPDIFKSINDSGLVFDGRLVVDLRLRTVDESIYGGGTLTKYSRLHRGALHHDRYSSRELGSYLAACVLQKIDPLSVSDEAPDTLPEFVLPRGVSAVLPGRYHYVRITLPRVDSECRKMPTGIAGESRFTVIKTGTQGKIQELLYYGQEPVEVGNLMCIVGLQESYVNSAESSYEKHLVADWISFLRSDWASALYHDRFPQFVATLRAQLMQEMGTQDLIDVVVSSFEDHRNDPTVSSNLRRMGVGVYGTKLPPSTKKYVEMRTLDFLRKNRNKLPRFLLADTGAGNK